MTRSDRANAAAPAPVQRAGNAHYPIAAFTAPQTFDGDAHPVFVDCPELAEALSDEYSIVTRADACEGITDALVALLGNDELQQMRYWRPQRTGDLIFNYWD